MFNVNIILQINDLGPTHPLKKIRFWSCDESLVAAHHKWLRFLRFHFIYIQDTFNFMTGNFRQGDIFSLQERLFGMVYQNPYRFLHFFETLNDSKIKLILNDNTWYGIQDREGLDMYMCKIHMVIICIFWKRKSMARLSVPPVRFLSTVITTPCASNDAQLSPNSLLSCNKRMTVNVTDGSSLQDSPLWG